METSALVNRDAPSRELIRTLRRGGAGLPEEVLPESVVWQTFMELDKRGEETARPLFIDSIRRLHSRRSIAGSTLPCVDHDPDEHRLSEDPMLADLWKAYKKCIRLQRTGPASQLLRDIEEQLGI